MANLVQCDPQLQVLCQEWLTEDPISEGCLLHPQMKAQQWSSRKSENHKVRLQISSPRKQSGMDK